jgi:hypothetical protein
LIFLYNVSMRVLKLTILSWVLLFFVFTPVNGSGLPQAPNEGVYIADTGHWINGVFYQAYMESNCPLFLFGYPITDQIVDQINGVTTQYFQRARMDLVSRQGKMVVQIAPLGQLLYEENNRPAAVPTNNPTCRTFPDTGKTVCYAFIQFYKAYGGEKFFGNPISEMIEENGRIVQYFENARMEWHPEQPSGQRVVLADLGRIYFDARIGDPRFLEPSPSADAIQVPVKIQANAFVSKPVAQANTQQTLFVIVQDQKLSPIRGAMVSTTFSYPDGQKETFRPLPTDADGISRLDFTIGPISPNEVVQIDVEVQFQDQKAHAASWFRVWW